MLASFMKIVRTWAFTVVAVSALGVFGTGVSGCGSDTKPQKTNIANKCQLNSECGGDLVCSFGLCHAQCVSTKDCPSGQTCAKLKEGDAGETSSVCLLPDTKGEGQCDFNTDCRDPLVCAVDRQCRSQCLGDRDCTAEQTCVIHGGPNGGNVCADNKDVNADGKLKNAADSGSTQNGSGGASGSDSGAGGVGGSQPEGGTCVAGAPCPSATGECTKASTACNGGVASCVDEGSQPAGTSCNGGAGVCDGAGKCEDCHEGDSCIPDDTAPCDPGTLSCTTGKKCNPDGATLVGQECGGKGSGKVCDTNNECTACVQDEACTPADPCHTGKRDCTLGNQCKQQTALVKAGTSCGTDKVCGATGSCDSCVVGAECSLDKQECVLGKQTCSNGANCDVTSPTAATDGISCTGSTSGYFFCKAGACAACQYGAPCVPTNPCDTGTLNCGTSPPSCNANTSVHAPDGTDCGTNKSCVTGVCLQNDRVLVVSSGDKQTAAVDSLLTTPVVVHLKDGNGANVPNTLVTVKSPSGAYAGSVNTDIKGDAKIIVRVGRDPGPTNNKAYVFTATAPAATSVTFTAYAAAPANGTMFSPINVNHTANAVQAPPQAGTISTVQYYGYRAVAPLQDGTLFVASYCAVYKLTIDGELQAVAGGNSCGSTADAGGAAKTSTMQSVNALAVDEVNELLYIGLNNRVYVVDYTSATPSISLYAGSGTQNSVPYGDGGSATLANLGNVQGLSVDPATGDLYVSGGYMGIRRVSYATQVITTWMTTSGVACNQNLEPLQLVGCDQGCKVIWDSKGQPFVSGSFCGDGLIPGNGLSYNYGVVRAKSTVTNVGQDIRTGTAVQRVVGAPPSGSQSDDVSGSGTKMAGAPAIAFDKAGNLYYAAQGDHVVRRVDSATDHVFTVAGTGTASTSVAPTQDNVAATTASLNSPYDIAFDKAGNLYIADYNNFSIRTVWGAGATTAGTVTMASAGGTGQSVGITQPFAKISVKLTDGSAKAVGNVDVNWTRQDLGSGILASADPTHTVVKTGTIAAQAGVAGITGLVGLSVKDYHFQASYTDIHGVAAAGSPQTFTVKATALTAGNIFSLVNTQHSGSYSSIAGIPGPAPFSLIGQTYALATATDGTIYFAGGYYQGCRVFKIATTGEVSVVAGSGTCGAGITSGKATDAQLNNPFGLALDEANGILYIADSANHLVRQVKLSDGTIGTFAGSGVSNGVPGANGTDATAASLSTPTEVVLGPSGRVYIVDSNHGRIIYVDTVGANAGNITNWLNDTSNVCNGSLILYNIEQSYTHLAFSSTGVAYVSGYYCGLETAQNSVLAVASFASGTATTPTRIAGFTSAAGIQTEGGAALNTYLPDIYGIAVAPNGSIAVSIQSTDRVRLIDKPGTPATATVTTVAGVVGTATQGWNGDNIAATTAELYDPREVAYWNGHLIFVDFNNYTIRGVY